MSRFGPHEFPSLPKDFVSVGCGRPWALVKRGGEAPGKRPFTKLAIITHISSKDGGRTLDIRARVRVGEGWSKKPVPINERDVVKQWRSRPDPVAVLHARRGLPLAARSLA